MSNQEGGDPHSRNRRLGEQEPDKSPPVPVNEPGRATPWPLKEAAYQRLQRDNPASPPSPIPVQDAEAATARTGGANPPTGATPMPEMETTEEERKRISGVDRHSFHCRIIRALDRALAEIDRLSQQLGEATGRIETDAKLIASHEAEITRLTAALAEAEDMADVGRSLMETLDTTKSHTFMQDWRPADDPAEIVVDLLNALDDTTARKEEREACACIAEGAADVENDIFASPAIEDSRKLSAENMRDLAASIAAAIRARCTP